ncbi:MAG: glutamate racemase [Bauldia sp.]
MNGPVLVFDSGIGGLSVFSAIRQTLGEGAAVYVADDAGFPYGGWADEPLAERVEALMAELVAAFAPRLVVIACNTASTLVLDRLRGRFAVPFVGTVPAIKPAAERTQSGLVSVLATPGTMRRDYTRTLIRSFAGACHVRLVGSDRLAPLAEARMRGVAIAEDDVRAEIAPAFLQKDRARTDVLVLACTHYPFLQEVFERVAPWPVEWIDPAPAIARQVARVLGDTGPPGTTKKGGRAYLTSGRAWPVAVLPLLAGLGLEPQAGRAFIDKSAAPA